MKRGIEFWMHEIYINEMKERKFNQQETIQMVYYSPFINKKETKKTNVKKIRFPFTSG